MTDRLAFRLVTGASLLGLVVLLLALGTAQLGPSWEVPMDWYVIRPVSLAAAIALNFAALIGYLRTGGCPSVSRVARRGFWTAFVFAGAALFCVLALEPEQWPGRYSHLSAFVKVATLPAVLACVVGWVVLVVSSRKSY